MRRIVNDEALDILFRAACTHRAWLDRPVSDTLLRAVWELVKLGPAYADDSGNEHRARLVFVKSAAARQRLVPALAGDEAAAPVIAVIGCAGDIAGRAAAAAAGALTGAYLILAARALGLDCRPIWQFDPAPLDAPPFADGSGAAAFLCALGYGDRSQAAPRQRPPDLAEACRIL
jgi:3-hydroxypropanoate dehydrogenase